MTPGEASQLLFMAAAVDQKMRTTNRDEIAMQAQAWAAMIDERMPFDDARRILIDHYATSHQTIMPSDINQRWWKRRYEALRTFTDPIPDADPDDVAAYLAELRANRERHGYNPERYGASHDQGDRTIDPKVKAAMKAAIESTRINKGESA